ncbi:hypothetical protein E0Z10_g3392 [Xylaria hypoxylon]|uniref:Stc1 domain-containing protein n=1 Tax=Xylaria hypoxylon TaxID=37992 RepID=A0A4Z0YN95_9PEZI|nr:hypothetical protein E0Z10_g3392 [Xylaria hypoxylon]
MAPQPSTRGAALPPSVCGKGKPPAAYSQTQLQKWYNKKRNDRRNEITPDNIGLTCKDHLSDQREIRCHGPCDRLKVVAHFSKRQRNDPEPWCIDCTEWRLNFEANEVPTEMPNGRLAPHEFDGIDDDEGWEQSYLPVSFDDEQGDEAESSDDDDENRNPYGEPNPFTDLADRLEGYNLGATDEGVTTDAVSTMDSVGISGWDQEDTNAGRSDTGSGISAMTVSRGYSSITNGPATPAGVAPHLNRLAAGPAMNYPSQITRTYRPAQVGQSMDLGESTSTTLSSRFSGVHRQPRHMSEEEIRTSAVALANEPPQGWKPNVKKEDPRKENNNKWYKGDNRRVFPSKKKVLANRVQDGREAAHDSDSPDEM